MKLTGIRKIFPATSLPRFNFGAWKLDTQETCLLGREVISPSESYYQPDVSNLLFVKMKGTKIVQSQVVWKAEKDSLLEDPRVLVLSKEKVLIGLTAVLKTNNKWKVYPAVTTFNSSTLQFGNIKIIQSFGTGKNTTPLTRNLIMFRPSGLDFFHKFLIFQFKNNKATSYGEISIPGTSWGKWKIGASTPPIWLTRRKALLFLIGINLVNRKYVYSMGRAFLEKINGEFRIFHIDPEPFITRETFVGFSVRELHPHQRKVVYMCGAVVNNNKTVDLYVNVGDRHTFVVSAKLDDLARLD